MDAEEKLFGMMAIAQEQQESVAAAAAALMEQREACEKERKALIVVLREMSKFAIGAQGRVETAIRDAIAQSMDQTVNASSIEIQRAFSAAMAPALSELNKNLKLSERAEHRLEHALSWLSWRWLALIAAVTGGIVLMAWSVSMATIAWKNSEVSELSKERVALEEEVARLNETVNVLEKRGGRAKLTQCGSDRRLCVQVKPDLAYGQGRDYFVIKGY